MCEHKNILAIHYASEETKMRIACRIHCLDCDETLFQSKGGEKETAYEYIKKNKDKFDTLDDYTCEKLNLKFGINYNKGSLHNIIELADNEYVLL